MRRGTRRWCQGLVLGGLLVGSPGLTAAPDGGTSARAASPSRTSGAERAAERQFLAWLEPRAAEARLEVRTLWRGDLDGDRVPERVALLCSKVEDEALSFWYVIEKSPSVRWLLTQERNSGRCVRSEEEEQGADRPDAGALTSMPWLALGSTIELQDGYSRWDARVRVALRDGRPSLVAAAGSSHDMVKAYGYEQDWERLRFEAWQHEIGEEQPRPGASALIPVLVRAQPLPPTVNRVTFGKEHWSGEADASLRVSALRERPDSVRVRVEVRDDVARPVPVGADTARFLAADHLELWWRMADDVSCDTSKKADCAVRQLGLALREDGGVEARWLFPEKTPAALPEVELHEGRVEVVLPVGLLGLGTVVSSQRVAFTVAFSDSDASPYGQQTLVATSPLRWGVPATFGMLVFNVDGRRYPTPDSADDVAVEARRLEGDAPLRGE
ncbi:hypothetical protein HPC49_24215 [Pyxidicoccus fallax]|uniref:Lipoprotein n=1 Tax=Pyxidicoccus fallax TaxID=394095 RepID=A0A848LFP5_9BACT|nr:hypothetical protein [Pyxidicoccus fallax]NMO15913.1 hypothetical protein [Pyxidicoccus fallax]NPC81321.1 hypothetical protein [Pyxidicoccus fallax]